MNPITDAPSATTESYVAVTETAGCKITREALAMMYTRYQLAAGRSAGKDVLEVACGSGQGLGLLAAKARRVVAGDFTEALARAARQHYGSRLSVLRLNAQQLPFRDACFDVVVLLEAIYYLPDAAGFFAEARRVLRPGGTLLICSANKQWQGFNPSPFSSRYFSARELQQALAGHGFQVDIYGAFPDDRGGAIRAAVRAIRRVAVFFHLIPKDMKGKELLKRLFYGNLAEVGPELQPDAATAAPLTSLDGSTPESLYKVIYALGRRQAGAPPAIHPAP
jgi:SAM-dependent methyltransferase